MKAKADIGTRKGLVPIAPRRAVLADKLRFLSGHRCFRSPEEGT